MRYTIEEIIQFVKDELTPQQIEHVIHALNDVWIQKEKELIDKNVEARLRGRESA